MEQRFANVVLNDDGHSSSKMPYIMVAAIDFGTTYSGYAFSFKNEPEAVRMNKNWGASLGVQSFKTPTCVLLNPQGEFASFGFEAEKQYGEVLETDEYGGSWSLFRHFKMVLHQQENLNRSTKIQATGGGLEKPAMDIFIMALRYLKQHLLETVSLTVAKPPDSSMIRWVITVPAIWTDESKRFMREAAFKASYMKSVDSQQLMIALEPEAASLHCRRLDVAQFVGEPDKDSVVFKSGTKYIVIDAGGGTVDITVHQILPTGSVRELHAATGGAWGGTKVDENFIDLLRNVLGREFIETYQKECPQQWLSLMLNFEKMKKKAKADGNASLNIPLPYGMDDKYTEVTGKNFEAEIKKCSNYGITFSEGTFIIKHPTVKQLFEPVIKRIINHMEDLLGNRITHPCKYFFLVGGFSESKYLQQVVMDRFAGRLDVLIPNEAQMSVIRGAVRFGHEPDEIKSRIARRTYGCDYSETFEPGKHKPSKLRLVDGVPNCTDLLKVFLKKGEEVEVGTKRSLSFVPGNSNQTAMGFTFYCLDDKPKEVQYLDEDGVKELGTATVQMPDTSGGKSREVELVVTFGGTEIEIYAKDATSGNIATTKLDFLAG